MRSSPRGAARGALVAGATLALTPLSAVACSATPESGAPAASAPSASSVSSTPLRVDPAAGPDRVPRARSVLAISIDGLNPRALRELGRDDTPALHRLMRRGARTLNARTEVEQTETLPNHTSMVTGRRIDADHHGHGVTWNDDRQSPETVQEAAGHPVSSVFRSVHRAGRRTGLFASKTKFSLFGRSWEEAVDRQVIRERTDRLARVVRRDIRSHHRALRFVHLADPDRAGHEHGFMSQPYLDAVAHADHLVATMLRAVRRAGLADGTVVIVTSDHGGAGEGHVDPTRYVDYRVPFLVAGPGVARGANLYDLNPRYRDPHHRRPGYGAERQPVRNGALGNLALDLLGIDAIRGSGINHAQDLRVRRRR